MTHKTAKSLFLVLLLAGTVFSQPLLVQADDPVATPTASSVSPSSPIPTNLPPPAGVTATDPDTPKTVQAKDEAEVKYIYEKPTRQKFSRLYWALGMLDTKKDTDVDGFLKINECDIWKDYFFNEFEWKNVRESARDFLDKNKSTFPLRFEVVQPLYLGEYDLKSQSFNVLDDYKIRATTRFEIFPTDYTDILCVSDGTNRIPQAAGYPVGVVVELNRPLQFEQIKLEPSVAKKLIDDKMAVFRSLPADKQTQLNVYMTRDLYLVLQIKFFAFKNLFTSRESYPMAEMMGVLEGYEIYSDPDKRNLLIKEDYRKKKKKLPAAAPAQPAAP